jgi:hypothetical protein
MATTTLLYIYSFFMTYHLIFNRVTRRVLVMGQELLPNPEHLSLLQGSFWGEFSYFCSIYSFLLTSYRVKFVVLKQDLYFYGER